MLSNCNTFSLWVLYPYLIHDASSPVTDQSGQSSSGFIDSVHVGWVEVSH